jgi:uracil-DNA glycosylase
VTSPLAPSLAQEFASALAWWQMAGVDCDFADDATTWLADPRAAPTAAEAQGVPASRPGAKTPVSAQQDIVGRAAAPLPAATSQPAPARRDWLGDSPPADLAAFHSWWMETPDLSPSRGFPRVPPRGPQGAALMVLVPQPEADDTNRLLSGPQGRLLANILSAMELAESAVYIAAALPAHTPMADLPALASGGMDAVTAHHVRLVAPARLVAFGSALGPMLGSSPDQPLREINYGSGTVPVLSSETLDALMDMPRLKARFWRRWMEWSATN